MTRVIAGEAGGVRLAVPKGTTTRPTSDRVREAVFSRLDHLDVLAGAVVLDLYAGSGALGLEAASRGAARVVLVDQHRGALAAIRTNAGALRAAGVSAQVEVSGESVARYLASPAGSPGADVAFLDPPYDLTDAELAAALAALVAHLAPGAVVVVERSTRSPEPSWPSGLRAEGERRYGETRVWYARHDQVAP